MDPAPWRKVTRAYIRTNHKKHGRLLGSVLSREWTLTLECGHERTRQVVVPLGKEPFWKRAADLEDNKKPKKARCWTCRNIECHVDRAWAGA